MGDFADLDSLFGGKAWLASELAEKVDMTTDAVRRRLIVLENAGLVKHVKEGRFNWYFTTKSFRKYLADNPEARIRRKLGKRR